MIHKGVLKTETILDRILANTAREVAERKAALAPAQLYAAAKAAPPVRDAIAALRRETVALIAECKRASPSKGLLIDPYHPTALAQAYAAGGAAAISVLTDGAFFQGSLDDLRVVRAAVDLPVLRKDFILDAYQVIEARAAGADLVLLIAAALDDALLADLHGQIRGMGMAALVEVHNAEEMERALRVNPTLIGINNRDLHSFTVDLGVTEGLAPLAPPGVTVVAESGVFTAEDVARMARAGAQAVLVGESLVKSGDVSAAARALSAVPH